MIHLFPDISGRHCQTPPDPFLRSYCAEARKPLNFPSPEAKAIYDTLYQIDFDIIHCGFIDNATLDRRSSEIQSRISDPQMRSFLIAHLLFAKVILGVTPIARDYASDARKTLALAKTISDQRWRQQTIYKLLFNQFEIIATQTVIADETLRKKFLARSIVRERDYYFPNESLQQFTRALMRAMEESAYYRGIIYRVFDNLVGAFRIVQGAVLFAQNSSPGIPIETIIQNAPDQQLRNWSLGLIIDDIDD